MATQLVPFTPSPRSLFSFTATLDGGAYNVVATWNVYGQRWYVNVLALDGTRVLTLPLIGSPDPQPLYQLSWLNGTALALSVPALPYRVGSLVDLVVSGAVPSGYNGRYRCAILSQFGFCFSLAVDPGPTTLAGALFDSQQETAARAGAFGYDFDLLRGYFATSHLVYRTSTQNFEVSDYPASTAVPALPMPQLSTNFILGADGKPLTDDNGNRLLAG